jgi:spermidine/putrescine transport system substrate-binding protein
MNKLTGHISRRTALKSLAAAGATGLAMPYIGNAEAATLKLRGLIWEAYNLTDMVAKFEADHGVKVSFSFFDGNAESYNQFRSGGTRDFDLGQADGNWPKKYFSSGLTQAVNVNQLPNLKGVFPDFLPPVNDIHVDEVSGARIAVPQCWGALAVVHNKSKISEEEARSMWVLFDEKYSGHLTTMARYEETIAWAGVLVAQQLGTDKAPRPDGKPFNPYVLTDEELKAVTELLIKQKKLLLTRYQDLDMLNRLMKTEQVWAGPGATNNFAPLLKDFREGKQNWEPGFAMNAKEGGLAWIDTWLISSGVTNSEVLEICHKWIDTFLSKENSANVVRESGFSTAVDCRELLTPLEVESSLMDRTDQMKGHYMFDTPSSSEAWERVWSTVEAS